MLKNLINLLFPKLCSGCNSLLLNNEKIICSECNHHLPLTQHHFLESNDTTKKFYGIIPIEFSASMLYFHQKGIVQNLIHNLKYKNHQEIGTFLGNWYAKDLESNPKIKTISEIIPVPLHKKRLRERGYNQLTTFGQSLSNLLNIPYNDTILHRDIYAVTQTKKSFFDRTDNKKTTFGINYTEKDHGKHFLLIDDVITTGGTLEACGKVLTGIPNAKVSVIAMAYSH